MTARRLAPGFGWFYFGVVVGIFELAWLVTPDGTWKPGFEYLPAVMVGLGLPVWIFLWIEDDRERKRSGGS